MTLTDDQFELLSCLIDDMEPLDQIVGMLERRKHPRDVTAVLLDLQRLGLVESRVIQGREMRKANIADFERAVAAFDRDRRAPRQSELWFELTDAGKTAWREKTGPRDRESLWRIAETTDEIKVSAVSEDVAQHALAQSSVAHARDDIELVSITSPAHFTLKDGTRVEPGVLLIFRRRGGAPRSS